MRKSTTFYIYEVGALYLLILFTLMIVLAFYQFLTGDELVDNLLTLLGACFLQLTVGWLSFSSMGRIKINDSEIVVDRNFKRYRLDLSTFTVSLGKKYSVRGFTSYPIFLEGKIIGDSNQIVKLKFLGNKRKNKALLNYYQEHLQPLVTKTKSLDQKKSTGDDFEKMVLDSKDRLTFPLSDLVEFGADRGNLTKTVFYHPKENKLYVGKSVPFPIIFRPSAVLFYGIYWLTKRISLHGFLPLVLSFVLMFLIACGQFKYRRQTQIVNVLPYDIPENYFPTQKSNGLKTYLLILAFGVATLGLSFLYLIIGSFLLLFLSFLMWYLFILLALSGQFKKSKYLKILEKKETPILAIFVESFTCLGVFFFILSVNLRMLNNQI